MLSGWLFMVTSWWVILEINVEWLAVYGDKLVGDFGDTYGLHEYNGTSWTQISEISPDNTGNTMVDMDLY
jgi:hypothetical protein